MTETARFAATVSYDGREFAGSQRQLHARTVQGELEDAAGRLFGAATRVELAGRTDAGVHATGQVAAFSAATALEPEWLERSGVRCGRAAPLTRARSRIVYKNPDSPRSSAAC